jgi:hypothetical protein
MFFAIFQAGIPFLSVLSAKGELFPKYTKVSHSPNCDGKKNAI